MRTIRAILLIPAVGIFSTAWGWSGESDSSPALSTVFETRLEMADGVLGGEFSIEHYWIGFVGTHVMGGLDFRGGYNNISAGLSVLALPFLLAQADVGVAAANEHVVDAPTFVPDYVTHLRAGLLIPVGRPVGRFSISMIAAYTSVVGHWVGGGFPPPGPPVPASGPSRSVERFGSFLLGLRMSV